MSSGDSDEQMQLARAEPARPGTRPGTLASSAHDKKQAAKFMREHLLPDTLAASRMAEGGGKVVPKFVTPQAPGVEALEPDTGLEGLSGWGTAAGLSEAMSVWQLQVKRLRAQLEGELQALVGTKKLLTGQDLAQGQRISTTTQAGPMDVRRPPSQLDQY
ncbi:hypothetical protein [Streptomyces spirodelae]|uniref:Uncharacterized protein n=1 Tax=Streptomyces spirodelae TaxID=2812904 RepID=A0ABS3X1J1_9ACTN|nr:hypothetical protein [Streptomyces spirodelae]MBO8189237.1 hypothetical protein [Streptomyces spirodelae]